jgi:hypothetical protein
MAHETLTSLRTAVVLSRSMRGLAERGEIHELVVRMHERDLLVVKVPGFLASLRSSGIEEGGAGDVWTEILSLLKDFERENALLIEALKVQRRKVVRNIAEAEGHRRLSAYAV